MQTDAVRRTAALKALSGAPSRIKRPTRNRIQFIRLNNFTDRFSVLLIGQLFRLLSLDFFCDSFHDAA
jgi:hypothetical protein